MNYSKVFLCEKTSLIMSHFCSRLEAREDDLIPPLPQALERHVRLIKDGDTLGVQVSIQSC